MQKNSTLYICSGIPWDNTYKNVRLFDSAESANTYIKSKAKYTKQNYAYIGRDNYIRADGYADQYFDCNYIAWQNPSYNNKWFYAFITDIQYVNDGQCNIYFSIDLFQTWWYNIVVNPSFVEREHTNDDTIGSSLTEENVMMGDPVRVENSNINVPYVWYMYATTIDKTVQKQYPDIYTAPGDTGNELSGYYKLKIGSLSDPAGENTGDLDYPFPVPDPVTKVQHIIDLYTIHGKLESLITLFAMFEQSPENNVYDATRPVKFGNYTPKNNKLFTYPYNYCNVVLCGSEVPYRYEWFDDGNAHFSVKNTKYAGIGTYLYPLGYQHEGGAGRSLNIEDAVPTGALPHSSFNANSFVNAMAQKLPTMAIGTIGMLITSAKLPGGAVGFATNVADSVASIYESSLNSQTVKGTTALSELVYEKALNIRIKKMQVQEEFARIIDNYFTCYGYKTAIVKVPNMTGRKSFNFVKTIDSTVKGSVPDNVRVQFREMLDSGVTFWHTDDIGNYDLDNSIVGGGNNG